jgi:hypothetical protein
MAILNVGPGQPYSTLASAIGASQDGDVVAVQAGTYVNDFATIDSRITIEGIGGMVDLVANDSPSNGKGILVTNTDVTLKNISFSGTKVPDGNGAGIRHQGGDLVVENSYFHNNQNGLLANPSDGTITIRNSEFDHNGSGDGHTHNLYANGINSLTITDSYFHDAVVGHQIKSRAENTTITGSRIVDGPNGSASYSVDLPNGGHAVLSGNVIHQGPASQNPAIIHFGGEGEAHGNSSLTVTGNTVINDLVSVSARLVLNDTGVTATVDNNSTWGLTANQVATGPANVSGITALTAGVALDTSSPWSEAAAPAPTPYPAPTPDQAPTPDPVPATPPSQEPAPAADGNTLVLHLSQDAWRGDAQFTVKVDGQQLGGTQTITASHGNGESQAFTFNDVAANAGTVEIAFLNDAWGGTPGTDRNMYVDSISYGGQVVPDSDAELYQNGAATLHLDPWN